ncbi:sugar ABC transporter permease [Micromonospora sonneratiae]|uniref:Carbohydrate ABC transporter permease n=1 Tax=Micromonospora sonneratiae TaxID=1184706 RepID=A0ABW3YF68_9ACTN
MPDLGTAEAPPRAASPPAPPVRPRRRGAFGQFDMKVSPYFYVAPFFVLFGIFGLFPLVYTAYVSLREWSLTGGDKGFVGLANYTEMFGDDRFWNALFNTFGIFIVSTVPQLLLALMLANWLNKKLRFRTAFRMGVLLPNITSVAAVGIVFGFIFADRFGLLTWLLDLVGINPIEWRNSRPAAWTAISFMVDWRWIGYNSLIYLAAMQAIPKDLYESASLDGASPSRQFWRLTVPLIQPTIVFTAIISTIGGMQLFTEPLMFGYGRIQGGSLNEFQTIAMYIYERTFDSNYDYGYGSAMSWTLFMLITLFALVNFLLVRRTLRGSSK